MGKAEKLVLNLGNGLGQIMFFWLIVLLNSAEQNHVLWIQQTFQSLFLFMNKVTIVLIVQSSEGE